jgi:GNAT superfamily N-acetyltransferase
MTQEKPLVSLVFRVATAPWEIEQIHRLNYQAFVEEIPQHTPNSERRLVDKFHGQNTYVIGVANEPAAPQVVAMMALRAQRPFSLDQKLSNLDTYLPAGRKVCEIRLLYIVPAFRRANVFRGLLETAGDYGMAQGWDLAIISGTTRQLRLYRHLGFIPFGPLVGSAEAQFQPMYATLESFRERLQWLQVLQQGEQQGTCQLLPNSTVDSR